MSVVPTSFKRSKSKEKFVSKVLKKVNAQHFKEAKNDITSALRIFPWLSPNVDTFVFDTGDAR